MPKYPNFAKFALIFTLVAFVFAVPDASARLGDPNSYVERLVVEAFAHAPEMVEIAKCESGFRQYNADGSVLKGGGGKKYVGVFQVDPDIHAAAASALGFDIYTAEGNINYSRHMHARSGTRPWASCVKGDAAVTPNPVAPSPTPPAGTPNPAAETPGKAPVSGTLSVNLTMGMSHPDVTTLQKFLNANGYAITASGPGSAGNETQFFGGLTRDALRRYQCARKIACDGNESTTGYGRLGPATRAAINSAK